MGRDATLRELASLVADPGAPRQVVHPDTPFLEDAASEDDDLSDRPSLVTCFCALQDIDETMGPTLFLPATNDRAAHKRFFDRDPAVKDALLRETPARLSTLGAGDVSMFDSRTLHCGTANVDWNANRSRALFYVSFKRADVVDPGNPGSIRPCYDGALALGDLRDQFAVSTTKRAIPPLFEALSRHDDRPAETTPRPQQKKTTKKKKKARGFGA
mmetsp:Transcript_13054/g.52282  ORF Transcript_13054/g.52282 Transcript_13054/m.52282 type:complete len:215 (+) Transcript_13054:572-1216(+)